MRTEIVVLGIVVSAVVLASCKKEAAPTAPADSTGGPATPATPPAPAPELGPGKIVGVEASTTLEPIWVYNAAYLFDGKADRGWVEGLDDDGVDSWVKIRFEAPAAIPSLTLTNGYGKKGTFEKNNRVKGLAIDSDLPGLAPVEVTLEDKMEPQTVALPAGFGAKVLKLEIRSVYPGTKYKDTVLSEVAIEGATVALPPLAWPAPLDSMKRWVGLWVGDQRPQWVRTRPDGTCEGVPVGAPSTLPDAGPDRTARSCRWSATADTLTVEWPGAKLAYGFDVRDSEPWLVDGEKGVMVRTSKDPEAPEPPAARADALFEWPGRYAHEGEATEYLVYGDGHCTVRHKEENDEGYTDEWAERGCRWSANGKRIALQFDDGKQPARFDLTLEEQDGRSRLMDVGGAGFVAERMSRDPGER